MIYIIQFRFTSDSLQIQFRYNLVVFITRLFLLSLAPTFDPTIRSLFLWPMVLRCRPIKSSRRGQRLDK
ncbi:hypothetical protein ACN38_g519 [Penicillium nordicum]|uniref:Uncharacterized protein n=1 Tax=Penicillium nordicum TaxID=229535 RepID=A0A0M9WKL5_9EURO|nr:hypothetical protein ACN38_g519 [Penicillium nordicum]